MARLPPILRKPPPRSRALCSACGERMYLLRGRLMPDVGIVDAHVCFCSVRPASPADALQREQL